MRYKISLLVFFIAIFFSVKSMTAIGLGLSAFVLISFFQSLGNYLSVNLLILVIADLQWVISPWLSYTFFDDHYKYHMYVPETEYMWLAVPALFFLAVGLFWRQRYRDRYTKGLIQHAQYFIEAQPWLPYWLIGIGIFCSFAGSYVPSSLGFLFYLLANIKYIGLVYLLFSRHKSRWLILIIAWLFILLSSIQSGMFHDFLLWTTMLGLYAAYLIKPSLQQQILSLGVGFLLIFIIQVVKHEYRQMVWVGDYTGDRVSLYTDLVNTRLQDSGTLFSQELLSGLVTRINQGWINSKIMEHVPEREPFAQGNTINEAVKAALLPRFLSPNKKIAGGKENFERFTGFQLQSSTSMGVSLLGEGYANYGIYGAWLFMLLMGLFYATVLHYLYRYSINYPTIILWLPLIFLQVVKAETELVVVLNHLVKSLILVLGFFWAARIFLNWKL